MFNVHKALNYLTLPVCLLWFVEEVILYPTSYYQVCVGEHSLSLHQSSSVPRMKKIKDPISVDSHWTMSYKRRNMLICQCFDVVYF